MSIPHYVIPHDATPYEAADAIIDYLRFKQRVPFAGPTQGTLSLFFLAALAGEWPDNIAFIGQPNIAPEHLMDHLVHTYRLISEQVIRPGRPTRHPRRRRQAPHLRPLHRSGPLRRMGHPSPPGHVPVRHLCRPRRGTHPRSRPGHLPAHLGRGRLDHPRHLRRCHHRPRPPVDLARLDVDCFPWLRIACPGCACNGQRARQTSRVPVRRSGTSRNLRLSLADVREVQMSWRYTRYGRLRRWVPDSPWPRCIATMFSSPPATAARSAADP